VFSDIIQGGTIHLSENAEEQAVWKFIKSAVPISAAL
jgi:hypothetical protein